MSENCVGCNGDGKKITGILSKYEKNKDNLIQILNEVQESQGYIPVGIQKEISEYLNISLAEVYGVITFYSRFTLEPKGKYNVAICMGTACFVKGADNLVDRLKQRLGIEVGETTENGLFSIEATRCIGACGLAPVFTINEEVFGKATIAKLDKVLDEYLAKEN